MSKAAQLRSDLAHMTHTYDGRANDGFCDVPGCGKPRQAPVHDEQRWVDPATGRVWGSMSDYIEDLSQREQRARAARQTTGVLPGGPYHS